MNAARVSRRICSRAGAATLCVCRVHRALSAVARETGAGEFFPRDKPRDGDIYTKNAVAIAERREREKERTEERMDKGYTFIYPTIIYYYTINVLQNEKKEINVIVRGKKKKHDLNDASRSASGIYRRRTNSGYILYTHITDSRIEAGGGKSPDVSTRRPKRSLPARARATTAVARPT